MSPNDFLDISACCALAGGSRPIHKATWHRHVRNGLMPRAVKVGALSRWLRSEVRGLARVDDRGEGFAMSETKTSEPPKASPTKQEYRKLKIADVKPHKWANIFPMQKEDSVAFKGFVQDVKVNRLKERITICNGEVLEGRHRLRALEINGVTEIEEYNHWVEYSGSDPLGFVLSANLHRRHLTTSQRAAVAARLAVLEKGANQHSGEGVSIDTASQMLNVSRISVLRAKAVLQKDGALLDRVEKGELTLNAAQEQAKPKVEAAPASGDQPNTPPAAPAAPPTAPEVKKKGGKSIPAPAPAQPKSRGTFNTNLEKLIEALRDWPGTYDNAVEWIAHVRGRIDHTEEYWQEQETNPTQPVSEAAE